jgi:hypothetical protein
MRTQPLQGRGHPHFNQFKIGPIPEAPEMFATDRSSKGYENQLPNYGNRTNQHSNEATQGYPFLDLKNNRNQNSGNNLDLAQDGNFKLNRKLTQGLNLADIEEEPSLLQSRINQFTGRGTNDPMGNTGLRFDPGNKSKRTKSGAVTERKEEAVAQKKESFSWDKLNNNLKKRLVAYVGKKNL